MDTIFIRELRLEARIGAYDFERRTPQTLQFDLEIGRDHIAACDTDRLSDTVDYAEVVKCVETVLAGHEFHLLEPLAEKITQVLFARFDARRIRVEVVKAGVVRGARFCGVRIERERAA